MKALSAGVSVVSITPPMGVELSGYGYYLERRCDGVRDEVLCKALVLDDGVRRVAVVANDLIGLDRETVACIRRMVEARTGIAPDHVLLACSHTHSGPATIRLRGCGEVDEAYVRLSARKIAGAVAMACEDMEPATVRVGHGECGLGFNRVVPGAPVDREVKVLRFDREDGVAGASKADTQRARAMAFVVNFSAHAVTFRGDNRKVSRDYPGAAADVVEAVFPESAMLFLQGSCGDVNPLDEYRSRPDEAGMVLAGEVLKISAGALEPVEPLLGAASREIALPLEIPDRDAVRRKLEEDRTQWEESGRTDRSARFSVESGERLLEKLEGDPSDPSGTLRSRLYAEIQAVRIGEVVLLAHPSELFTEFGLGIKEGSPAKQPFVVGYANDFVGYVPDRGDFERGGYAAATVPNICDNFPFAPNVGSYLVEESLGLIEEVMHA